MTVTEAAVSHQSSGVVLLNVPGSSFLKYFTLNVGHELWLLLLLIFYYNIAAFIERRQKTECVIAYHTVDITHACIYYR